MWLAQIEISIFAITYSTQISVACKTNVIINTYAWKDNWLQRKTQVVNNIPG